MQHLLDLFAAYGLLAVFLGVLLEQVGLPTPALPFLLLAGAHAADDAAFGVEALALGVTATMLAGGIWYGAGRRYGRRVLSLLCRVSMSPDSCVRQSELTFARRGAGTLVLGKFIPGVPGALHLEIAAIPTADRAALVADRQVVTYCACPQDASAAKAARLLAQRGIAAHILAGGIDAWQEAGLPTATALDRRAPAARPPARVEAAQASGVAPD